LSLRPIYILSFTVNPNEDSFWLLDEAAANSSAFRFELRSELGMAAWVIYSKKILDNSYLIYF
jgi:hypothetical protein